MFSKVVQLVPDNQRGYNNLGGMYLQMGRYDEALRESSLPQSRKNRLRRHIRMSERPIIFLAAIQTRQTHSKKRPNWRRRFISTGQTSATHIAAIPNARSARTSPMTAPSARRRRIEGQSNQYRRPRTYGCLSGEEGEYQTGGRQDRMALRIRSDQPDVHVQGRDDRERRRTIRRRSYACWKVRSRMATATPKSSVSANSKTFAQRRPPATTRAENRYNGQRVRSTNEIWEVVMPEKKVPVTVSAGQITVDKPSVQSHKDTGQRQMDRTTSQFTINMPGYTIQVQTGRRQVRRRIGNFPTVGKIKYDVSAPGAETLDPEVDIFRHNSVMRRRSLPPIPPRGRSYPTCRRGLRLPRLLCGGLCRSQPGSCRRALIGAFALDERVAGARPKFSFTVPAASSTLPCTSSSLMRMFKSPSPSNNSRILPGEQGVRQGEEAGTREKRQEKNKND